MRTFATSFFNQQYSREKSEQVDAYRNRTAAEVLTRMRDFVRAHCRANGLTDPNCQSCIEDFIDRLESQCTSHPDAAKDLLSKAGFTAQLLWTSNLTLVRPDSSWASNPTLLEHNSELCTLLNSALRTDHADVMPDAAKLVHAINVLCLEGGTQQRTRWLCCHSRVDRADADDVASQLRSALVSTLMASAVRRSKGN